MYTARPHPPVLQEYQHSPNLAQYLGLHPIDALHMSVPLNLVFIGFQGDGNAKVDVTSEELTSWFSHIDHVLPHTRVALSELSCSLDGEQQREMLGFTVGLLRRAFGARSCVWYLVQQSHCWSCHAL